jgi:glutathione synthase/RimK-type ligase-like ATP-grasp enzyme
MIVSGSNMSIAILYEQAGTDEMGIQLTAEKLGIDLTSLPARKIFFLFTNHGFKVKSLSKDFSETLKNVSVVLNRVQSRNRRLALGTILETLGKKLLNPLEVEYICFSKLRTILHFWKMKVSIPATVYVPCDPREKTIDEREITNEYEIVNLILQALGNKPVVLKPDAGSHGKDISLAVGCQDLISLLRKMEPSIINPIGVLAQEFINKWFFDLRIIVTKERGKPAYCHSRAMARAGLKDFRTNAYRGNMVFGVNLPQKIREKAALCAESIGKNCDAWVLALDAMLNFGREKDLNECVQKNFEKLKPLFDGIRKVKSEKITKENFTYWNEKLEEAFNNYASSEAYRDIQEVIEESIKSMENNIVFHEANSCPDFWEQTRLATGINLAEHLLTCAESLIDKAQAIAYI